MEKVSEVIFGVDEVAIKKSEKVHTSNLTGVSENDDLGVEGSSLLGGVVLRVGSNHTTTDFLNGDVLNVEADVVTGDTLSKGLVVHFDGLNFSGDVGGGEGDDHTGLNDTGFDTTDGDGTDTTDLVHILEGETEGFVGGAARGFDGVDGVEEGLAGGGTGLGLLGPSLEPGHVVGGFQHVVTVPAGDGDEGNGLRVVSDLLDEVGQLLHDFVETVLGPFVGVHLVDGDDELTDTEGESEESVLTGLTVLRDTGFEFTNTTSNDEDSTVGLQW